MAKSVKFMHRDGKLHEYKHGLGPCGKVVNSLSVEFGPALVITQHCTDGSVKRFAYPWHLVESKVTEE